MDRNACITDTGRLAEKIAGEIRINTGIIEALISKRFIVRLDRSSVLVRYAGDSGAPAGWYRKNILDLAFEMLEHPQTRTVMLELAAGRRRGDAPESGLWVEAGTYGGKALYSPLPKIRPEKSKSSSYPQLERASAKFSQCLKKFDRNLRFEEGSLVSQPEQA